MTKQHLINHFTPFSIRPTLEIHHILLILVVHVDFKCNEFFATKGNLNMHISQAHTDRTEESSPRVETRQRESTPAKCFECERCDQLFGSESFF